MQFCRVAVNFKTAAPQHRNTATQSVTPNPLRLTIYVREMISGYLVTILITLVVYAILAHSLNIITGRAGQISLGHAAFFGIGAYAAAMFYTKAGLPF